MRIPHICNVDRHLFTKIMNIELIAAVLRNQAVDERDLGAGQHEPSGQVRSNKTETAGDQHPHAIELLHDVCHVATLRASTTLSRYKSLLPGSTRPRISPSALKGEMRSTVEIKLR